MKMPLAAIVCMVISGCIGTEGEISDEDNHAFIDQSDNGPAYEDQHFSWDAVAYELVEMPLKGTGAFTVLMETQLGQTLDVVLEGDGIQCNDVGNVNIAIGGTSTQSIDCNATTTDPTLNGHFYGVSSGEILISYQ